MRPIFHADGKTPDIIDWLNRVVRAGTMLDAVAFSILVDLPSGPLDFEVSRAVRRLTIWSSTHRKSGGQSSGFVLGLQGLARGWLKH